MDERKYFSSVIHVGNDSNKKSQSSVYLLPELDWITIGFGSKPLEV